MALKGGMITININVDPSGIKTGMKPINGENVPVKVNPVKPKGIELDETGAGFDVELMARDKLNDEERIDLEQRVVLYVRSLLDKNEMKALQLFLDKTKHHLGTTLREMISEEIKEKKNGK